GEKVRSPLSPYGSERFNSVRCSPVIGRTPALAAMRRAEPTPRRSPSSASLSPEFRLAAACAMWPPSDYRNEAIRVAGAGVVDWPRFVRLTARHRIFGLVRDGLTRAHPDLPPAIARQITAQAEKLVRQDLAMAAECLRLKNIFGKAGVPILFVKGASLAI